MSHVKDLEKHTGASHYLNFQQGYEKPSTVMFRVPADTADEARSNVAQALTTIVGAALPITRVLSTRPIDGRGKFDVTVESSDPNALISAVRDAANQGWKDGR